MSKWLTVLIGLVALNLALLAVGSVRGGSERSSATVRVGLVFDVGGLGDKSFNDGAHRGLMKARDELAVGVRHIEPGDGTDRESALRLLASSGYDLVIGVGFIFTDDITKLAKDFPKVKFACIDYSAAPGKKVPANLAGLRFREHEGSFLVGAIAGLVSKSKKLGFVGGMKIPLIRKFEAGFAAGVAHVCPECQFRGAYAGTEPKAFADPTTGRELALTQYGRGVDIIYHASGSTGSGVFNAAKEQRRMAIGVDADQYEEAPCCVLTSMLKKVDVAVFDTIRDLVRGTFRGGVREFGLRENGVGYVYDKHNRDRLPRAIVDKVEGIRQRIIDGEIEVPFK